MDERPIKGWHAEHVIFDEVTEYVPDDDIATRLRSEASTTYEQADAQVMNEAADEIARLRAALTECADAYDIADVMAATDNARKVLYG